MSVDGLYTYHGDRMTDPSLRGARCAAVKRLDGKCITGRGSMLVMFDGEPAPRVVLRRHLRKARATPKEEGAK